MKDGIHSAKHFFAVAIPTAFVLLLGDRITKMVAPEFFNEPYVLVPGFLELSFLGNRNFIFYWEVPIWIILLVISVVMVMLGWQFVKVFQAKQYMSALLLTIVFVGALSNVYDRIFLGYVIDFVRVPFWSVFNFADVYIVGGIFALVFFMWQTDKHEEKEIQEDAS